MDDGWHPIIAGDHICFHQPAQTMDLSKEANATTDVDEHHKVLSNPDEVIEQSNGMLLLDIGYQKGDFHPTDLKTTRDGHVRVQ